MLCNSQARCGKCCYRVKFTVISIEILNGFIVIHKHHNSVKHEGVMELVLKQMIRNYYKISSDVDRKKETCFIEDAVSC